MVFYQVLLLSPFNTLYCRNSRRLPEFEEKRKRLHEFEEIYINLKEKL
jgi:hypothetical protein